MTTRARTWLHAAIIVLAVIAAYANSCGGPFVYDDLDAIVDNPSIHHLATALHPPADTTVSGRPLLNLSFAASYALSGSQVWSYHALNILIHALAALALLGFLRRALRWTGQADLLAFAIALVWAVHPLQTESISYVVQRAESLMGLFFLLALYGFARAAESSPSTRWAFLSVAACYLGCGVKENAAMIPIVALAYDWLVIGRAAEPARRGQRPRLQHAWRQRGRLHLALFASWILVGWSLASTGGNRSGSIGLGIGISPFTYALTQFRAIATYLWLAIVPNPLIFDRGPLWVHSAGDIVPYIPVVVAALAAGVWAVLKRPRWGFWAVWFFVILAPTSLVPGTTQMVVEHRMYLSLAAVLVLVALGLSQLSVRIAAGACFVTAALFALLTAQRNADYRSKLALWADTIAHSPTNGYARANYGVALADEGRYGEAEEQYRLSLQYAPNSVEALTDMGNAEMKLGRPEQALGWYTQALRQGAPSPQAHIDYGNLLTEVHRFDEAIAQYQEALRLRPHQAAAECNWGFALAMSGYPDQALQHYEEALRLKPEFAEARFDWANAQRMLGQMDAAAQGYEATLQLDPNYAQAAMNLGTMLLQGGRLPEAIDRLQAALRSNPHLPDAHNSLGLAYARGGDLARAIPEFEEALRLRPNYPAAQANLEHARNSLR